MAERVDNQLYPASQAYNERNRHFDLWMDNGRSHNGASTRSSEDLMPWVILEDLMPWVILEQYLKAALTEALISQAILSLWESPEGIIVPASLSISSALSALECFGALNRLLEKLIPYLVTLLSVLASLCHGTAGRATSGVSRTKSHWHFHQRYRVGLGHIPDFDGQWVK